MVRTPMRRNLARMISPTSLSAFSASVTNGGIQPSGVRSTGDVQQARAQAGAKGPVPTITPRGPQTLAPGQYMPRGSLLDLTA